MTKETIIKKWRAGYTKFTVAKDYMQEYNREAKKKKRAKDNKRPSTCLCRANNI